MGGSNQQGAHLVEFLRMLLELRDCARCPDIAKLLNVRLVHLVDDCAPAKTTFDIVRNGVDHNLSLLQQLISQAGLLLGVVGQIVLIVILMQSGRKLGHLLLGRRVDVVFVQVFSDEGLDLGH
eukprot:6465790-Prymnesium_polylepis.3